MLNPELIPKAWVESLARENRYHGTPTEIGIKVILQKWKEYCEKMNSRGRQR